MNPTVGLIGPVCSGKSTLAPLIADRLGVPWVDVDEVADGYLEEVNKGRDELNRVGGEAGFLASYLWWEPGLVHVVGRAISSHRGQVLAFGAGHSHVLTEDLRPALAELFAGTFTVLVLPSPDLARSCEVLKERSIEERDMDWVLGGIDFIARWVNDPQNHDLADLTVYTEGRSASYVADEVSAAVRAIN